MFNVKYGAGFHNTSHASTLKRARELAKDRSLRFGYKEEEVHIYDGFTLAEVWYGGKQMATTK